MNGEITRLLKTVRQRTRLMRGSRWGAVGLLLGAALGTVVLLLQRADVVSLGNGAWLLPFALPALAFVAGWLWPESWSNIAERVDRACGLKDRALTAVAFAKRDSIDSVERLQMADAVEHLKSVDAREVVPARIPRMIYPALTGIGVMVIIASLKAPTVPTIAPPEALPVVLEQSKVLEETMLEELKELAEEFEEEELDTIVEEMEKALEELKQPEVDQREALAKLSEMQQTLAAAMQEMNVELVDAQLQQLSAALDASTQTEAASLALAAQDYEKAATELEKIDADSMSRKEKKAVEENLAKLAEELGSGKQGELSEAISEMSEGMKSDSNSKSKSGAKKLAGVCRKQSTRKSIKECLACQLNRLSVCKGQCQGNCASPFAAKSDSPSQKAGTAKAGFSPGDKTNLASQRREESITGSSGEGPSERETTTTLEARQDAARSYSEKYTEYRKQVEEVLDSEPLPLGHRQAVRSYFEAIRPQNGDVTE